MSFTKKTLTDLNLYGKRVLLRADYNVPIRADGDIADDYRIQQSLPTIRYLLSQNCKLIICAHLGRPAGPQDKHCSLRPVAKRLHSLIKQPVKFVHDCTGPEVAKAAETLDRGQILVLENLRFYKEEEQNDPAFAKQLASLADAFVQDAFGVVHRAHASTQAITRFLPSVAGLLLEKEVDTITNVIDKPARPLMVIVGGAKIADKLDVLERFIELADVVAVGGAMANTFLLAGGVETGKSLTDPADLPLAKDIIAKAAARVRQGKLVFYLPQDGVVAKQINKHAATRIVDWSTQVYSDIERYPRRVLHESSHVKADELILDIGPFSGAFMAGSMQLAKTVIWNGTMGMTEIDPVSGHGPVGPFAHGTDLVVEAMLGQFGHRPFSVVGGGDTVAYVEQRKLTACFDHVSTGGGASLELMSGKKLPGVQALEDK